MKYKINLSLMVVLFLIVGGVLLFSGPDALAQRTCLAGQVWSGACNNCIPNPVPTGDCSPPTRGIYNSCGVCDCASPDYEKCDASNECNRNTCTLADKAEGKSFDACTGDCDTPYAIKSPSSAQEGYISVKDAVDSAPTGSISYRGGQLQVKQGTGWQSVGANYTADRNIDILTGNLIAVKPNPNFDKLTISDASDAGATPGTLEFLTSATGDKLSLASGGPTSTRIGAENMYGFGVQVGTIYQKSFDKHQWYSATNVDGTNSNYIMQLDRDTDDTDTHLTVRGNAGRLADIILRDGNNDRWALSSRDGTPNFEIWRNNGTWLQALKIDYNSGGVNIPGPLSITGKVDIAKTLYIGSDNLQADRSLITANARYISLGADEYLFELRTTNNENVSTPRFTVDKNGNLANVANITTSGSLTLNGAITGATNITASGNLNVSGAAVIDNDAGDITDAGGGVLRVGRVTPIGGSSIYLRLDKNEISSFNSALYLNAHNGFSVNTGGDINTGGNIDVGGVIKAGSTNAQITSVGGGLKMAELADEDFDSASEGFMILGAAIGTSCKTVCENHGLKCPTGSLRNIGFNTWNSEWEEKLCQSTELKKICFCDG